MIKSKLKPVALLVLTLFATMAATAQTVNMSRYITLTVQQGQQIRLDLQAAAANTGVRIISGSTETEITVGTGGWIGFQNYTAGSTTMTVYGDIIGFDCSGNGTKLTALDVSHNTELKRLDCYSNNFTTQAFNDLMCSLPARVAGDNARFYPLRNASDAGVSAFMAANSQIATGKSWQVRYLSGNVDIPATTGTYTCPVVNMSRYITLAVQQGEQIQLGLWSAAAGTPVKIVSGSTNRTITVGTGLTGFQNFTAGSTTMTVYGDITGFYCSDNGTKLTALNVSHNTALKTLYCESNQLTALDVSQNTALKRLFCHGNSFTTQAFNDLMCSLPVRTTADNAKFYPLWDASDATAAAFMAANSQIATGKNWQVRYQAGNEDEIPATTGTYVCGGGSGSVNMSRYITLTVTQGQQIQLDLMAAAAGTPVKIVSGSTNQTITVGTDWTGYQNYTAGAGTMTVYGDITRFACSGNGTKLTALDVSHNTALTGLYCHDNQLTALDVSHNTALTELGCYGNQLTSLDVSRNTALTWLNCHGNSFTTQAFNDLMCSLPARTTADGARFFPLYDASDATAATFMATNSQIATAKNWQVRYHDGSGAIPATTGTYVCGGGSGSVNMSRYITLTVQQGQQIRLNLRAAAAGTPVKIVSGSTNQTTTVGTSGTGFQNYTAGSITMTVYGDITRFDCSGNGTKLTALDVTQNTALTGLYCGSNQLTSLDVSRNTALKYLNCRSNTFTTQAFNDLMCSLPARTTADNAKFYPLLNVSDANHATFMAANAQIAKNKGWQVRYWEGNEDEIPATIGTYTCPVVNMSRYITLTVQQGQQIELDLIAAAAGTKVKVVSGSTNQTITVGTSWTGFQNYTAGAGTMTVYGDIIGFDCSENGAKLTALDVSHNTELKRLYCQNNQITALDVTQNTALEGLYCRNNRLTSLNVSHNTALTGLSCSGNNFTTQAFNDLMCSLPARTTADDAEFYPLWNASDASASAFMAANSQIAKDKNWKVMYGDSVEDIPATTGTYVCGTGIAEMASVPLSVYPNPATDILTIETEAIGAAITITDLTGRTVLTATATAGKTVLNLSELSAGTYIVRVGDRVGKVVKR